MIGNDWDEVLNIIWQSPGFNSFLEVVKNEYQNKIIYPPKEYIFNALKNTPYKDVKVVIVGQDPYHNEGQAHGLSFSVQKGVKTPPSLKNIYQELENDLGIKSPNCGDLTAWTKEGVLLLNATLTVIKDNANSHKDIGWQLLTDSIIKKINLKEEPVVYILWGNFARSKKILITNPNHLVIESTHPSPFSAHNGFFGSKPFSKANEFLEKKNVIPINWQL